MDSASHRDEGDARDQTAELLQRVADGDAAAKDALFSHCYPDLKRLAHLRLNGGARSATLDTTALVHDVYFSSTTSPTPTCVTTSPRRSSTRCSR